MFRQFDIDLDYDRLKKMVYMTPTLNYFICMAFEGSLSVYKTILFCEDMKGQIILGVFHRKSGNLQIAINPDYNFQATDNNALFSSLKTNLEGLNYKTLILPKSVFMKIESGIPYKHIETGAEIEKLYRLEPYEMKFLNTESNHCKLFEEVRCNRLNLDDLIEVEALYKVVFKGHPSEAYMRAKFEANRGKGYGIWCDGKLVSVAQTDFYDEVIVGVGTLPDFRGYGFSRYCLQTLINSILPVRQEIQLQVENPIAIGLYKSLGFEAVDQILHVTNSL